MLILPKNKADKEFLRLRNKARRDIIKIFGVPKSIIIPYIKKTKNRKVKK